MKIALSAGHNTYNNGIFDNGSVANGYKEANITKKTVAILLKNLKDKGYIVKDITPYNKKFRNSKAAHLERSRRVKNFNPDLYLDIHVNAGGGTGPETIVYSTKSKAYPYARKIVNSIASNTKLRNRGVKVKRGYWSVSLHPQPSVIIEGGFIDSPNNKDMKVLTPKKYANYISRIFPNLNKAKSKKNKLKEINSTMTEKEVRKISKEEALKQIYPSTYKSGLGMWAEEHFINLNARNIQVLEKRYQDNISRGETFKLLAEITEPNNFLHLFNRSYKNASNEEKEKFKKIIEEL